MSVAERTIVFDCFGVLFTEGWFIGKVLAGRLADRIEREALRARYRRLATGRIDRAAFWAGLVEDWPAYERAFIDELTPDPQAVELLERLHGRYRLAMCSEGVRQWYDHLWAKYGLQRYFDVLALSSDLGVTKPGRAFFEAAERVIGDGRKAYVDDKLENLAVAAELGWHTIWMRRIKPDADFAPQATICELRQLPGVLPW
jgi:HAD superfamily hydrolase (TIGR01509 family)